MKQVRSLHTHVTDLVIRPAESRDYWAIATIYNEAIAHGGITMDGHPYSADDINTIIQKMTDREMILVAELHSQVIGWGVIRRYSDRLGYQVCCETSIYLTCSKTHNGYGRQLQTVLMEKVQALGYHHVVAKILAANQSSVRFHQKFGFEVVGIQKEIGFIQGTWHDVVIMQYIMPDRVSLISN